jgi:hypothetical protein
LDKSKSIAILAYSPTGTEWFLVIDLFWIASAGLGIRGDLGFISRHRDYHLVFSTSR